MPAGVSPVQEMEQMQRYNQRLIEELKNKQTQEKTRLPKIQRSDAKTRMAMFKKSLRITGAVISPEQEREKVKQVTVITQDNLFPLQGSCGIESSMPEKFYGFCRDKI